MRRRHRDGGEWGQQGRKDVASRKEPGLGVLTKEPQALKRKKNSTWYRLVMMGEFNSGVVWLQAAEDNPLHSGLGMQPGEDVFRGELGCSIRAVGFCSRPAGLPHSNHTAEQIDGATPHQRPGGYRRDERGTASSQRGTCEEDGLLDLEAAGSRSCWIQK
ncbi:hypothetical protein BGZ61DRAFT_56880 [Ilyonectria robusta]|uniref:uncharacterized protein n=1 Tax=Ilyonectria robusta TaxID=1079257 RepID=UPI001E8E5239|nr:uncharacterized protein BGZ61DRAFT_56880 [Ilyonectria robusta]KAH8685218.1 hypothetical protein BGZ61DRAFT_56880 [Ilyonectria robusta]